jgi:four helix bundle protein
LRAWLSGKDFCVELYRTTSGFPRDELYGLTSQMRRAAVSVCSNLAEGCGYRGSKDSARFYQMSFGSSSECYSDMYIAQDLGYLNQPDFERLESLLVPTRKQVYRLLETVRSSSDR